MRLLVISVAVVLLIATARPIAAAPKTRGYENRADAAEHARQLAGLSKEARKGLYGAWKKEFGMSEPDGSPKDQAHFKAWSSNLDAIVAHNAKKDATYSQGLNAYSHLSFEEFKQIYLMGERDPAAQATQPAANRKLLVACPSTTEVDLSEGKTVPPIRDQGRCGSCWAFSALGALEYKAIIEGVENPIDLSEQQMVDCVGFKAGYGSRGCKGGWSHEVFHYVARNFATNETKYQYTAQTGACKIKSSTLATYKPDAIRLPATDSDYGYTPVAGNKCAFKKALANAVKGGGGGALNIYWTATDSFQRYDSGVYSGPCSDATNHAMVLAGYSVSGGYWLVRNSWGLSYGESGYVRVAMGDAGLCGMYIDGGMLPEMPTRV